MTDHVINTPHLPHLPSCDEDQSFAPNDPGNLFNQLFSKSGQTSFEHLLQDLTAQPFQPSEDAAIQARAPVKLGEAVQQAFAFIDVPLLSAGAIPSANMKAPAQTETQAEHIRAVTELNTPQKDAPTFQPAAPAAPPPEASAPHQIPARAPIPAPKPAKSAVPHVPLARQSQPLPQVHRSDGAQTTDPALLELNDGGDLQHLSHVNVALVLDESGHKLIARIDQLSREEEEKLTARARQLLSEYGLENADIHIQTAERAQQPQGSQNGRN